MLKIECYRINLQILILIWKWESNENTNGLLRNFYPKRVDFYDITQNELDAVVNIINNRFCKCFEYLNCQFKSDKLLMNH